VGSPVVSRTLTIFTVAFLTFDGAALAGLGLMTGRLLLVPVGLAFFIAAGLIVVYWRRHRRTLEEIGSDRRALSEQARALRESVSRKK
jgi:uncharacterized iron-regulated membrane protein